MEYPKDQILNGLELDKPIYKYMPLKYVEAIIKNKEICFKRVNSWEDVYENFFLKATFDIGGIKVSAEHTSDLTYGQCWTYLRESDAMWRIYSTKNSKVSDATIRVKTTPRKLLKYMFRSDPNTMRSYMGTVQYMYGTDLKKWFESLNFKDAETLSKYIVPSLFIKRMPFNHEKEVRLVYLCNNDNGDLLRLPITDPLETFDEFVIDPRTDEVMTEKISVRLLRTIKDINKIKKSTLYKIIQQRLYLEFSD